MRRSSNEDVSDSATQVSALQPNTAPPATGSVDLASGVCKVAVTGESAATEPATAPANAIAAKNTLILIIDIPKSLNSKNPPTDRVSGRRRLKLTTFR